MTDPSERLNRLAAEFTDEHGFSAVEQGLVLSEETGELNEEILKSVDGKLFKDNSDPNIREEAGQVIYTVVTIGHLFGFDAIEAALEAAEVNADRTDTDN